MATSLFTINATLPIVFIAFIIFVNAMKAFFFDPIMQIKVDREKELHRINQRVDENTRSLFEAQNALKREQLVTQQLVQQAYQEKVNAAQSESAQVLMEHKQRNAETLERHRQDVTARLSKQVDDVLTNRKDYVDRLVKRLMA
jgi:F0F1-type ATP synthase membrane subunit b/b'